MVPEAQSEVTTEGSRGPVAGLEEVHPGQVWVRHAPLRFLGFQFGSRMTVVRLANGSLFLHSPVKLDAQLRESLESIGPVRHIVSPNKLHHLYLGDYKMAFPEARLYAPPGLKKKRKDLRFTEELDDHPEAAWADEIDQVVFRGHPWIQEVAFCHRASHTLLVGDLLMNFHEETSLPTKLLARIGGMYGKCVPPTDFRITITDRQAARRSAAIITGWGFDRIILSHGRMVETGGKAIFRRAYSWLFR